MDKLNLFFLLSLFLDLNQSARCDKTLVFLEQLLDKPQNYQFVFSTSSKFTFYLNAQKVSETMERLHSVSKIIH